MEITFSHLVDEIQKLNRDQIEELKILLEKYLVEIRREEIYQNFIKAKSEVKEEKLKFNSNINEIKKELEE